MRGETLHDYFQKFVQLKAKAPDVPDEIAIEAAIKGLRIGPFAAHLARKKPTSIQQLYDEFEKYCKSDNDLRKRLEEQGQNRQQNDSKTTAKTPRKPIRTRMYQIRSQARGKCSVSRVNLTLSKGNRHRQHGRRPRQGTKVSKVTKAKTGTKTTSRNNAGHIAFFMAKAQGTTPKIVRRQKRHRKG